LGAVNETGLLQNYVSPAKHCKIRNALDPEVRCKFLIRFRIYLEHKSSARHLMRHSFHFGSGHSARTAPARPEINQHGHLRLANYIRERFGINVERFRQGWQARLA
jgi:hypothetical protein